MNRFIAVPIAVTVFIGTASSSGAEVRTYRFVPDGLLPYSVSCGECALPYLGSTSDIAGAFTISIDFDTDTGTLIDLDENLVDFFNVLSSSSGPTLEPVSPPPYSTIIPPWVTNLGPPFEGSVESIGDDFVLSSDDFQLPFSIAVSGTQAHFNMTVPIDDFFITVTNALAVQVPEPQSTLIAFLSAWFLIEHRSRRY